jgi:hypothetical protein
MVLPLPCFKLMSGGIVEFDLPIRILKWQSSASSSKLASLTVTGLSVSWAGAAWLRFFSPTIYGTTGRSR